MAYRKRGDSYLVDVSYKGTRAYATVETEDEAKLKDAELMTRLINEHKNGKTPKKIIWTLKDASDKAFKAYWLGSRSEVTNQKCLGVIKEFFKEDTLLSEIDFNRIGDFKAAMKERGNGPATINRRLMVLSKVLSHAVSGKGLEEKPEIQTEELGEGIVRAATADEEDAALRYLYDRNLLDAAETWKGIVDTGLRPSEWRRLEARHCSLSLARNTILVEGTKTNRKRVVPLTSRVAAHLTDRIKKFPFGPLYPFNEDWMDSWWRGLRKHLNLVGDAGFVPYCLRHTFATRLAQAGVGIEKISKLMGHRSIKTTANLYIHLCVDDFIDSVAVLEKAAGSHLKVVK